MTYQIHEVEPTGSAEVIRFLNSLATDLFPPLADHHLENGYWWLVFKGASRVVGMAGMVPFFPFMGVGYLKRCYILPDHRGGLQRRLLAAREAKAKELGWSTLVSECRRDNTHSIANFIKAGFVECHPEQKWAGEACYLVKHI